MPVDLKTQLDRTADRIASARVIAKAIIDARQGGDMKEKMKALREYMGDNRRRLTVAIDGAYEFAQEVYPQAHDAVAQQRGEVDGIMEELKELQDEANQAMGGNHPPPNPIKGGSANSDQSSDASKMPPAPQLNITK